MQTRNNAVKIGRTSRFILCWKNAARQGLSPLRQNDGRTCRRMTLFATLLFLSAMAAEAANPIWICPLTYGAPIATYYLGDSLSAEYFINLEIGQSSWNYAQIGYGTSSAGTSFNWGTANWYEDGTSPNKRVRRDIGGLQFTASGNWYLIFEAKESSGDTYTSAAGTGWMNATVYPPASMDNYFTVSALNNPSSPSATQGTDPNTQIYLTWSKNAQSHNVMIVRKTSIQSWTEPTQGTPYSVAGNIGVGVVVYNSSGTSFENSGLTQNTTYDYKFYSENNSYYSAGVTAQATTAPEPGMVALAGLLLVGLRSLKLKV